MLETAVGDSPEELWLQQEIPESGGMDADIAALLICVTSRNCQVAFLGRSIGGRCWLCCSCFVRLEFLIGVVDEIFFVRHNLSGRSFAMGSVKFRYEGVKVDGESAARAVLSALSTSN